MVAFGSRISAVASVVALLAGAPLIIFGDTLAGLAGVVLIIASAIALLVSVGTYLGEDDRQLDLVDEQASD